MSERDHLDRLLASGLEQHLAAQIEQDSAPAAARLAGNGPRPRTLWVTAVVGLAVVLLTVFAIRAAAPRGAEQAPAYAPPASPSASPTPAGPVLGAAALMKRLPAPDHGRVLHTWTEQDTDATGPFDPAGDTVVIAGVCNGGGAVSWTDVTGKAHTLGCNGLRIQQPAWRFNLGGDGQPTATTDPVRITVRVLQGTPRFVVRMWAVDPRVLRSGWYIAATGPTVPKTLRTCEPGDLAPTGTSEPLSGRSGTIVTVTNASSSDCAVRSWAGLRYLDADGDPIGPAAGMSLDSGEGELNRYHEFPPARLPAGGHGYLIADLYSEARLQQDDDQQAAAAATASPDPAGYPTPTPCEPVRIAALRLTIAGSSVSVPIPDEPARAACRSDTVQFGVDPLITTRPADG